MCSMPAVAIVMPLLLLSFILKMINFAKTILRDLLNRFSHILYIQWGHHVMFLGRKKQYMGKYSKRTKDSLGRNSVFPEQPFILLLKTLNQSEKTKRI